MLQVKTLLAIPDSTPKQLSENIYFCYSHESLHTEWPHIPAEKKYTFSASE